MKKEQFIVATPEDFSEVINTTLTRAAEVVDGAAVVTLTGDLGAGKTTFTQQLAAHLGIQESVVSPTFGIMKIYDVDGDAYFDQLIHIDAYRIEDISEAGPLRLAELFMQPRTLICLEWPERIAEILPQHTVSIEITIAEDETRLVALH